MGYRAGEMLKASTPGLPFSYEEYSAWFDRHAKRFLAPAKEAATTALNEHLDAELQDPQRIRIRVGSGRVKSKARTWKKLNDKYADRVKSLEDIPAVVDDLVGLRVVCTNKSDADRLVEILENLDEYVDGDDPVLATRSNSSNDWRLEPKASGYRAYHINICTSVAKATKRHAVVCELQIRTLLQDSWGELTHEDTYKPGADVPLLVDTLSRRMADLMATLDDIAEDLRTELDRLAHDSLTEPEPSEKGADKSDGAADVSPAHEAAEAYLRERVSALRRPIALPTLAWELQREFGGEISEGWLGYGTFKRMLESVASEVRVSPGPASYVLPADFELSSYDDLRPGVPRVISLLKEADKSFPLIPSEHWPRVYSALAAATHEVQWTGPPDLKILNELTKTARDAAENTSKDHISRGQLQYVAFALMSSHELITEMTAEQIENAFAKWTLSRSAAMGFPKDDDDSLESWLRGKGLPEG